MCSLSSFYLSEFYSVLTDSWDCGKNSLSLLTLETEQLYILAFEAADQTPEKARKAGMQVQWLLPPPARADLKWQALKVKLGSAVNMANMFRTGVWLGCGICMVPE